MTIKGIDERADEFALQIDYNIHKNDGTTEVEQSIRAQGVRRGYVQGATEQDSIARQEERERCIKAAIKAHCSFCPNYLFDCSLCNEKEIIRKTIEEDEGGDI